MSSGFLCSSAQADIELTFYSHDFGENFPHTFIKAKGSLNKGGSPIDEGFGFTAKTLSPAILMGSVKGIIEDVSPDYLGKSDAQFKIIVSDEIYNKILEHNKVWLSNLRRSYNLNKRNCVHYISEIIVLAGLNINEDSGYFKKPKSFLREVISLNAQLSPLSPLED